MTWYTMDQGDPCRDSEPYGQIGTDKMEDRFPGDEQSRTDESADRGWVAGTDWVDG